MDDYRLKAFTNISHHLYISLVFFHPVLSFCLIPLIVVYRVECVRCVLCMRSPCAVRAKDCTRRFL